jgi:hypothetical protein
MRHYVTRRKVAGPIPDVMGYFFFPIYMILPAALWSWGYSTTNRNGYHESSWGDKERPARKSETKFQNKYFITPYTHMHTEFHLHLSLWKWNSLWRAIHSGVFTAAAVQIAGYWILIPYSLVHGQQPMNMLPHREVSYPWNGGSTHVWKFRIRLQGYTVSRGRRPQSDDHTSRVTQFCHNPTTQRATLSKRFCG